MPRIIVILVLSLCAALAVAPATQAAPVAKKTVKVCKKKQVRTKSGKKKTVKVCWKKTVKAKKTTAPTPAPAPADPAPAASEPETPAPGGFAGGLRDCANRERAKAGLGSLKWNVVLAAAATAHVLDMKLRKFFAHENPDGESPFERIDALFKGGNPFAWMGENIAKGFSDVDSVCKAWMESPGHRANIMRPQFDSIGTAWLDGYSAQEFGGR